MASDRLTQSPTVLLTDADLTQIVKDLFHSIDMPRHWEQDYETALDVLRRVYNAGRARGAYEIEPGARC